MLGQAFVAGADVSLEELLDAFSDLINFSPDDLLGNAGLIKIHIEKYGLLLEPAVTTGNFRTRRVLKCKTVNQIDSKLDQLIEEGETSRTEFKGSLFTNLARLDNGGGHHKSDEVTHSSLKTIGAFGNSDGGVLLIGVEDSGKIRGLETDFITTGKDRDGWENDFRSLIAGRFRDGVLANTFVNILFAQRAGLTVACVSCVKRSKPVFLKHPKEQRYEFYIRQGNRSASLDIPEVLDFLATSR